MDNFYCVIVVGNYQQPADGPTGATLPVALFFSCVLWRIWAFYYSAAYWSKGSTYSFRQNCNVGRVYSQNYWAKSFCRPHFVCWAIKFQWDVIVSPLFHCLFICQSTNAKVLLASVIVQFRFGSAKINKIKLHPDLYTVPTCITNSIRFMAHAFNVLKMCLFRDPFGFTKPCVWRIRTGLGNKNLSFFSFLL